LVTFRRSLEGAVRTCASI